MKGAVLAACLVLVCALPAQAKIEAGYNPGKPRGTTAWHGAKSAADLDFIKGMRPHHAGALTMSRDYLEDADARNVMLRALARAIIRNQEFEIAMLDRVESDVLSASSRMATEGLAQALKYSRAPLPGLFDAWSGDHGVSRRDVQFAKAMIVHHQAALDMSNAYLADAAARNGYLRLMCLDILQDQKREIALMQKIIASWDGDADSVKIDASMIHGMDHHH